MRPEKTSGQLIKFWSDQEIQNFCEEWDIQLEMRNRNHALPQAIAKGLKHEGLRKSWWQCLHMLLAGLTWDG